MRRRTCEGSPPSTKMG